MEIGEIKLIPLRCPECGSDIDSREDDRIFFCMNCGKGFQLEGDKFKEIGVLYAKPEIEVNSKQLYYLPMWQILTEVSLQKKYVIDPEELPEEILKKKKFTKMLTGLFNEERARKKMIFFVPAFGVTNRYHLMDHPGFQFTVDPPKLKKGRPRDMVGAEYSFEDAVEIARVMFLSIQSHTGRDILEAEVEYNFIRYRIAGIPFFEDEGMLVDGIKGFRIFKDALKDWDSLKR